MLFHIGQDVMLSDNDVVGVFDVESTTADGKDTAAYLSAAEKNGDLVNVMALDVLSRLDTPRTFLVCDEGGRRKVYLTSLSVDTVLKKMRAAQYGGKRL